MKHIIEKKAKEYAERSCNGQFPIEYSREQVVKHTTQDFIEGAKAYQTYVLSVLRENYEGSKDLTPEDKARSAQEIINETYEDLIKIFEQ